MNNNGVIKKMQRKLKISAGASWQVLQETLKRMLQFRAGSSLRVLNVETGLINSNQSIFDRNTNFHLYESTFEKENVLRYTKYPI